MSKDKKDLHHQLITENRELRKDISALKDKLSRSSAAFMNIVGRSLDGVLILDENFDVVYSNYTALEIFEKNAADLLGEKLNIDLDIMALVQTNTTMSELTLTNKAGEELIYEVHLLPSEWSNKPCYSLSLRDISERKRSEELLDYMSKHDHLTDLPNRVLFEKQLNTAIIEARDSNIHMALLYIDLDNFKMINDHMGHGIGDLLLKQVSNILKSTIRSGDSVSRLGGDEFAIILKNLKKPNDAAVVSQLALDKLSQVFKLEGKEVYTNASIGIAVYPHAGKESIDLVKNADSAMYDAKDRGKNQFRFYTGELNKRNEDNLEIVNGIRKITQGEQLYLEYQPIIDIGINQCVAAEALVRWKHPVVGMVPPDNFLPFAQEYGMMHKIGEWVFKQAMHDYGQLDLNALFISINMSANELDSSGITDMIMDNINKFKLDTHQVVLELTETAIMKDPEGSIQKLQKLADIGVLIAVDDFGTGYSSLSYLKKLPLFILKLDKSFIDDIGQGKKDDLIVRSTIELAHGLGLRVIAEGVEREEQLDFLKSCKCDYVQGYYFSKPICFEKLKSFIENNQSHTAKR